MLKDHGLDPNHRVHLESHAANNQCTLSFTPGFLYNTNTAELNVTLSFLRMFIWVVCMWWVVPEKLTSGTINRLYVISHLSPMFYLQLNCLQSTLMPKAWLCASHQTMNPLLKGRTGSRVWSGLCTKAGSTWSKQTIFLKKRNHRTSTHWLTVCNLFLSICSSFGTTLISVKPRTGPAMWQNEVP